MATQREQTRLDGGRELERLLAALPGRVAGRISRDALRAGAKIIQAADAAAAPKRTGQLARTIKVRSARRRGGRSAMLVQTGKGFFKGDTFYGAFQEMGWRAGKRSLGSSRREIPGKHFMLEGFLRARAQAVEVVADRIKVGLEAEKV